ncbi:unnamed protein product [Sphenostylis stenocarpa]|uniref:Uncharacterized protein n=1 Tax=Sphenostylis stenocarpa TaxID=92480 RepID=A0AA86S8N2_9FABA|nr:unnamed protein product [Sphenostylis stenocarpa]
MHSNLADGSTQFQSVHSYYTGVKLNLISKGCFRNVKGPLKSDTLSFLQSPIASAQYEPLKWSQPVPISRSNLTQRMN